MILIYNIIYNITNLYKIIKKDVCNNIRKFQQISNKSATFASANIPVTSA